MGLGDFTHERLEVSNPWRATWHDGSDELEVRILFFFGCFVCLHCTMLSLKKRGMLSDALASRPTFVANNCHCCVVAPLAIYLLWTNYHRTDKSVEDYALWQKVGIPATLAYFLGDVLWYCVPARYSPLSEAKEFDFLILLHHVTMLACHYPIGSLAGAALCGAGDPLWSVELSCLGYLCEVSNPLMNYRWWLTQTLTEHRADFSVVAALLVASFVARTGLLVGLLFAYIPPKFGAFAAEGQVLVCVLCVAGHAVVLALSLYWLSVLTRGGPARTLVYAPRERSRAGGFAFGADMGRSPVATPRRPSRGGESPRTRAYSPHAVPDLWMDGKAKRRNGRATKLQ